MDEAIPLFLQAAHKGDAIVSVILDEMYYRRQGVKQNYCEAIFFYKNAADQGYAPAQFILGCMSRKVKARSEVLLMRFDGTTRRLTKDISGSI